MAGMNKRGIGVALSLSEIGIIKHRITELNNFWTDNELCDVCLCGDC
jgi:hypothetical protein